MLRHEALEHYLMNKYNFSYKEAHNVVEKDITIIKNLKKIIISNRLGVAIVLDLKLIEKKKTVLFIIIIQKTKKYLVLLK